MSQDFIITQLEETIDQMQDVIGSLEADILLLRMEVVERGDAINQLTIQNNLLKKQLQNIKTPSEKVSAILLPPVSNNPE